MVEALLKIVIDEKSELHKTISLLLKVLLTLFTSHKLYGLWIGKEWIQRLPDWGQVVRWMVSGEIIIGIIIYFIIWLFFYVFIRSIIIMGVFWMWNKFDTVIEVLLPAIPMTPVDELSKLKGYSLFKKMGLFVIVENKIQVGWLVAEIAKDLKKSEEQNDGKPIVSPNIDSCLVIHFVVSVFMIDTVKFLPVWTFLIGIVIVFILFIVDFLGLFFNFIIRKYRQQLISLTGQSHELRSIADTSQQS
jgi:hypothetical protein